MMQQLAPLTEQVVTVDHAWETSYIYPAIVWNVIGMVHFINTNDKFNVCVDRDNASKILFTKSNFNQKL